MIKLSEAAKSYIRERGGGAMHILQFKQSSLCCGRVSLGPVAQLGVPRNREDYVLWQLEETAVYLPPDFAAPEELTIEVRELLGFKSLAIEGWRLA